MHTIYFIPGLGADERLFSKLKLNEYEKKYVHWVPPLEHETLPEYAKRLSPQIDTRNSFSLIGVSFGGMIVVEMSKILKPDNLILISSAKTYKEIPWNLRFFKYVPVYKFLTESFVRWFAELNKHLFGIFNKEEEGLFADMLLSCPVGYLKRVMWMILHWKNTEYPNTIVHIHRTKDRVFPIRRIKIPLVVKGGTHFMPYHNAEEVEKIIKEKIGK